MKPFFLLMRNDLLWAAGVPFGNIVFPEGSTITVVTLEMAYGALLDHEALLTTSQANIIWRWMEIVGLPVDDEDLVLRVLAAKIPEEVPEGDCSQSLGVEVEEGTYPPQARVICDGEPAEEAIETVREGLVYLLEAVDAESLTPSEAQTILSLLYQAELPLNEEVRADLIRKALRFDLRLIRQGERHFPARMLFYEEGDRIENAIVPSKVEAKRQLLRWVRQHKVHPLCHAKVYEEAFGEQLPAATYRRR